MTIGRSSINSTMTCTSRMVGRDGVGDLFENGGLARARAQRSNRSAATDGRDEIDDARLKRSAWFRGELLDRINAGEILEAYALV